MSDPQAALSRAQDVLQEALDEARSIAGNPNSGDKPRKVAEAVIEASPLVDEAYEGWPEGPEEPPPEIEEPPPEEIEEPPPEEIGEPGEEELPPVEPDPDLSDMTAYQPEPGTPSELTAALNALSGKPACGTTFIRCKGSLALTGTFTIGQKGHADGPLIITAPSGSIGQRDPGPKPSMKHVKITGDNVWLHGFAAELPGSDTGAAVTIADGADDVTVSRCWLDCPAGVEVHAATRFRIFANDFYGAPGDGGGSQIHIVVTKSGPLPEDGLMARNFLSQLKDFKSSGIGCYSSPGVPNPSGDKSKPFDRNIRSTAFYENYVRSIRKYLVYNKHAMQVLRNKVISAANHADHEGKGDAYHVLASRGGNWTGGRWAYNVCRAGSGARIDVQGWNGLAEFNDFGGINVNVWCGMDQSDGKALLGANSWDFVGNEGGKYQVGTTRNGAYWLEWPLEDVLWEGEVGASWRWEASASDGDSYKPSGGPEIPWAADGTNSQKLVLHEKGKDKTAVAVGSLRRSAETEDRAGMPLAHDLDETNTGLAYRG